MKPARYRFRSTWVLPVPPYRAFEVLKDLRAYPAWWSAVKEIERIDDSRARTVVRSFLPYVLRFDLVRTIEDPTTLTLETRLEGDLEGTTRWTIGSTGAGYSVCRFDEDVVTNSPLLNALAPVARLAFTLNHRWMMRVGRRGLVAHLERR